MAAPSDDEIREVYAALSRGDVDVVAAYAHADVEYVNSAYALEGGTRRGRDVFEEILHGILDTVRFDQQVKEIHRTDEEIVVVLDATAQGVTSGAALSQEMVHALTWDDGKLTRFRWFRDVEEAREAGVL
jgi:ketosteroid isomerase-like protein